MNDANRRPSQSPCLLVVTTYFLPPAPFKVKILLVLFSPPPPPPLPILGLCRHRSVGLGGLALLSSYSCFRPYITIPNIVMMHLFV